MQEKKEKEKEADNKPRVASTIVSQLLSAISSAGDFLELHHMQALIIFVIVFDIFCCLAESCLINKLTSKFVAQFISVAQLSTALKSFGGFANFLLTVEIIGVTIIFNKAVITHWGYMMDIVVTAVQIYFLRQGFPRECRLLHLFRFWRIIRLFNSLVNVEKELHDHTKAEVDRCREENRRLVVEKDTLRVEVQREKEARVSIEETLQTYKEEVDTLNEALKIAAMDIAEVAQGDEEFAPSEDGEVDGSYNDELDDATLTSKLTIDEDKGSKTNEDSSFFSAVERVHGGHSINRKQRSKEELMRAVLRDNAEIEAKEDFIPSTFVVHEDGSFVQK